MRRFREGTKFVDFCDFQIRGWGGFGGERNAEKWLFMGRKWPDGDWSQVRRTFVGDRVAEGDRQHYSAKKRPVVKMGKAFNPFRGDFVVFLANIGLTRRFSAGPG